jgi:hypothetical protein
MLAVVARMVQPPLLVAVHKWLSPRGPARSTEPQPAP